MNKAITAANIVALGIIIFGTVLSVPADAKEKKQLPRGQFHSLQKQIDVLNRCRQPVLNRLQVELLRKYLRAAPDVRTDYSLTGLFNISLPNISQQMTLLDLWLSSMGSVEDFWKNLESDPPITNDELYELRLTLFLARLTDYNETLLLQLRGLRQVEGLTTLLDISRISDETWRKLLEESGVVVDPDSFIRSVHNAFDDLIFGGCN